MMTMETIRIIGFRQWLYFTLHLDKLKEWAERIWYCHHNARALADAEYHLSCVLMHGTGGRMSNTNYEVETMTSVMDEYLNEERDEAFKEGFEHAEADRALKGEGG